MEVKNKLKNNLEEFWENFTRVITRPEMAILPGQLAFFFVLAIVPSITLITYGASLLNLSTDIIFQFLSDAFSADIAGMLLNVTDTSVGGIKTFLLIIIGYYMASNGPASIIVTSNTIYGEKQSSFLRRRIKSMIMTFFLVLLFIFMLIVPVFGNTIIDLIQHVNLNSVITARITSVFNFLQGPITWLIIYFFIKVLYTLAPNKQVKSKSVGYGAIFTSIGWILTTGIYSFYINNYAHYSTFYGGLANIVILMLWFYFLAYIFTIGMALNYRKEEVELEKTATLKIKK